MADLSKRPEITIETMVRHGLDKRYRDVFVCFMTLSFGVDHSENTYLNNGWNFFRTKIEKNEDFSNLHNNFMYCSGSTARE